MKLIVTSLLSIIVLFSLPLMASPMLSKHEVLEAQTILGLKDLYKGRMNGVVGPNTIYATRIYQKKKGLHQTGELSDIIEELRTEAKFVLMNDGSEHENIRKNGRKYTTKEEIDYLKKELLFVKELLHKSKHLSDQIEGKIDSKIESETATHIVSNFSELIRSSLTALTLIVALLSFIGLPLIHGYIKNRIEKIHGEYEKESENRIFNTVFVQMSHAFYLYYRSFFKKTDHAGFKSGLSLAIWFTDGAIRNAEKISNEIEKDKKLKFSALHRAYHYASESLILGQEGLDTNQKIALDIARDLQEFINKTFNSTTDEWVACKETIAWVYILLGDKDEHEEGKRILKSVLKHRSITKDTLKEIVDNYYQIKDQDIFSNDPTFIKFIEDTYNKT